MGALILTNAKETCSYDSVNNKFLLGGATSGSQPISVALVQSAKTGSIDGIPCEVTVRYIDQSFSDRFETIHGTYSSVDNSITRVTTIASSTGTGQISFDETAGPDNLVIYGTTSHSVNGVQVLQQHDFFSSDDAAITSTSLVALPGTEVTVVSTVPTSVLDYKCRLDTRMQGQATADDVRGRVILQFFNASSVWQDSGISYFLGHQNVTAYSTTPVLYEPLTVWGQLTSGNHNTDGNWQIRIAGEVDFANNTLQNFSTFWSNQEKIKY